VKFGGLPRDWLTTRSVGPGVKAVTIWLNVVGFEGADDIACFFNRKVTDLIAVRTGKGVDADICVI